MIFLLVFVIGAAITRKQLSDISNWWTIVATIANIVTIAVLVLSAKKNGMISPIPKQLAVINFLFLPITTAFAEDGLYLGCGVNAIENKAAAIVIPALFYALQHCFIPTLFDMRYIVYRFLSFLPLTFILCGYYYKKRDPIPVMIGHALIDMMTVSWVLASSMIPGFYEILLNI